jgi:cell division protein FtsI (penicillin-binding protein 3)
MAGESRIRLISIALFFGLCFLMLGVRLAEVVLVGGGDIPFKRLVMQPQLMLEQEEDVDVSKVGEAQRVIRRDVTDRNGMVLATSIATASLVANPTIIRHEDEVARGLAKIFPEESYKDMYAKLMKKHATFVYLRRHLTPGQQEAVNNLGVPGLFFESDMRRVYPYGGLFAHTLGYVGVDNQGLAGVEKHFDSRLQDPVSDKPLQLSLDLRVQSILSDELAHAMKEFSAIGASGIISDIKTGEVLAISSLPQFNPNQPAKASENARFNRATLGVYEMGSTFKTLTAAAALDAGTVGMGGGYDASSPIHMAGFTIKDFHPENRWLSVAEIIGYSSNIGTAKMALDLGGKRQQEFLRKVGMFEPVKLELPEVGRPILPRHWSDLTTMTVSYGHGISISPLQMVRAMATVSGDGRMRPLTLVKGGNEGKKPSDPVVKGTTIEQVRELMRLVVKYGTGKSANAPGYLVGGKTGTAEKLVNGRYAKGGNNVTIFAGVFPVNDPQYTILIMVDEPKGTKATYGFATAGWISAPVVGRVVQRMAPLVGIKPDFQHAEPVVDALWARAGERAKAAEQNRLQKLQKEAIRAVAY